MQSSISETQRNAAVVDQDFPSLQITHFEDQVVDGLQPNLNVLRALAKIEYFANNRANFLMFQPRQLGYLSKDHDYHFGDLRVGSTLLLEQELEHRVLKGEFLGKLDFVPIVSQDFLNAIRGEEGSMRVLGLLKDESQFFKIYRRLKAG